MIAAGFGRRIIEPGGRELVVVQGLQSPDPVADLAERGELKERVRTALMSRIDPAVAGRIPRQTLRAEIAKLVSEIATEQRVELNEIEESTLATELADDVVGLGPLEPFLEDDAITDVMANGPFDIYVERDITADSTASNAVHLQGGANAQVTAQTIVTAGGVSTTGNPVLNLADPAQVGAPPQALINPYAPNASGSCSGSPCLTHTFLTTGLPAPACSSTSSTINGLTTLTWSGSTPGAGNCVFNGTQQIKAPGGMAWNLSPGTYWINNGDLQLGPGGGTSLLECLACNGTNLGVTIIFTTTGPPNKIGAVLMQSTSAQIGNLNAPNAGTFKGLLFVQDTVAGATYTQNGTLQGGPNVALVGTGLVYFPHTNLAFQGTPTLGTNGCLIVYANTVALQGNSTLAATGCPAAGLGSVPTIQTVYLAE
jgi:hypothetical protein